MISLLLDVGIYTTHFVLSKVYNGVYGVMWGKPKDPLLLKMDQIEKSLEHLNLMNSRDAQYYWSIKKDFKENEWILIRDQNVLLTTPSKVKALTFIANNEGIQKILLVQVGKENEMVEI